MLPERNERGIAVDSRDLNTDERQWLELTLYELAAAVRAEGKAAVLYCGACRGEVAYNRVVPGSIREWPYCPIHTEAPLMIRSASVDPCSNSGLIRTAKAAGSPR